MSVRGVSKNPHTQTGEVHKQQAVCKCRFSGLCVKGTTLIYVLMKIASYLECI